MGNPMRRCLSYPMMGSKPLRIYGVLGQDLSGLYLPCFTLRTKSAEYGIAPETGLSQNERRMYRIQVCKIAKVLLYLYILCIRGLSKPFIRYKQTQFSLAPCFCTPKQYPTLGALKIKSLKITCNYST